MSGRLCKDPELRATRSGLDVVSFGGVAAAAASQLSKGSRVVFSGKVRQRTWEDEAGTRHYRVEIVADDIVVCGERAKASGAPARPSQPPVAAAPAPVAPPVAPGVLVAAPRRPALPGHRAPPLLVALTERRVSRLVWNTSRAFPYFLSYLLSCSNGARTVLTRRSRGLIGRLAPLQGGVMDRPPPRHISVMFRARRQGVAGRKQGGALCRPHRAVVAYQSVEVGVRVRGRRGLV